MDPPNCPSFNMPCDLCDDVNDMRVVNPMEEHDGKQPPPMVAHHG